VSGAIQGPPFALGEGLNLLAELPTDAREALVNTAYDHRAHRGHGKLDSLQSSLMISEIRGLSSTTRRRTCLLFLKSYRATFSRD
jgi:hypothetical protein